MWVGGQRHDPVALPTGTTRFPLHRGLGGLQGRSGRVQKISPTPGFDPRIVQPVPSRYPGPLPQGKTTVIHCTGCCIIRHWHTRIKVKAVPLQAQKGPEGSRKLRFPDFVTTAQDGGKVVSLTHRPPLPPGNTPDTHFC